MAGLIERAEHITTQWFKEEGDAVILLGAVVDSEDPLRGLGGSAYLQQVCGLKTGAPPRCNLAAERELHLVLRALIHSGVVKSAHDCSDGGLAVALAESCVSQQIARDTPLLVGARIDLSALLVTQNVPAEHEAAAPTKLRLDALLFGETQGRILISTAALDAVKVVERAKLLGIKAARIGTVGGNELAISTGAEQFSWPVAELYDLWWNAIAKAMR
jgi:phosphoribosylformylglycinamidine synthase